MFSHLTFKQGKFIYIARFSDQAIQSASYKTAKETRPKKRTLKIQLNIN